MATGALLQALSILTERAIFGSLSSAFLVAITTWPSDSRSPAAKQPHRLALGYSLATNSYLCMTIGRESSGLVRNNNMKWSQYVRE